VPARLALLERLVVVVRVPRVVPKEWEVLREWAVPRAWAVLREWVVPNLAAV
jgi:hypothetical protein